MSKKKKKKKKKDQEENVSDHIFRILEGNEKNIRKYLEN